MLWAWSPLVVMELGLDAHVDALGIALLVGGARGVAARAGGGGGRAGGGGGGGQAPADRGAARHAPPQGVLAAAAIVAVALALPYAAAGPRMSGSLGEYSRRWRANDGAFALLYVGRRAAWWRTRASPGATTWPGRRGWRAW